MMVAEARLSGKAVALGCGLVNRREGMECMRVRTDIMHENRLD